MTLVVAASAGVWCGSSVALRWCGISAMWLRYPVALVPAYALFLVLSGLLARRTARRLDARREVLRRQSRRRQWQSDETDEQRKFDDFLDDVSEGMRHADNGDAGAGLPALIVTMLATTVVLVCIYFIWMAPVLFGELIVEGALATWLYRPSSRGLAGNWLDVSLEQTGLPAFLMAVSFLAAGIGFQVYAPEAETIVDVFHHAARQREVADAQTKPIFGRH
jgi:hypothetical protein